MGHPHKHGIHLLGKHSNKKAVQIIKGIGKGVKGVADEVYKFTPMGFLERNPMMGMVLVAGGVILVYLYFKNKPTI